MRLLSLAEPQGQNVRFLRPLSDQGFGRYGHFDLAVVRSKLTAPWMACLKIDNLFFIPGISNYSSLKHCVGPIACYNFHKQCYLSTCP